MLYREIRKSRCLGPRGALALLGALGKGQNSSGGQGTSPGLLSQPSGLPRLCTPWELQLQGSALTICLTCTTQGTWQSPAGHCEKCPLGCPGDTSWCPPSPGAEPGACLEERGNQTHPAFAGPLLAQLSHFIPGMF